jgi:hypothetical protein
MLNKTKGSETPLPKNRGQALTRVCIGIAVLAYLGVVHYWSPLGNDVLLVAVFYVMTACFSQFREIFDSQVGSQTILIPRGSTILDWLAMGYVMVSAGMMGIPIFAVFVIFIIDSGLLRGRTQLMTNTALAFATFTIVLLLNDWWADHLTLGLGMLAALVGVAAYLLTVLPTISQQRPADSEPAPRRTTTTVLPVETDTPTAPTEVLRAPIGNGLTLVAGPVLNIKVLDELAVLSTDPRFLHDLIEGFVRDSQGSAARFALHWTTVTRKAYRNPFMR